MPEENPEHQHIQNKFAEILPIDCPLPGSNESAIEVACRFHFFENGDERNYLSHHALGKSFGDAGECRGKSISLQTKVAVQQIMLAKRHAHFKKRPIALHNIPEGSGKSLEGKSGHVDFWPFADFDFNSCLIGVFPTGHDLLEALNDE